MKIEKDTQLYNRYYQMWSKKRKELLGTRSLKDIKEIVVHHTEGTGNWIGLRHWMLFQRSDRNKAYGNGIGLFQFCIEKEGAIINCWPLEIPVFHSSCYLHDKETIGIEIIHKYGEFTPKQYESLNFLISYLINVCDIKRIVTHDYNYLKYSKNTKGCPGKFFKWFMIEDGLNKRKIKFTSNNKNFIELDKNYKLTEEDKNSKSDSEQKDLKLNEVQGVEPLWIKILKIVSKILLKK